MYSSVLRRRDLNIVLSVHLVLSVHRFQIFTFGKLHSFQMLQSYVQFNKHLYIFGQTASNLGICNKRNSCATNPQVNIGYSRFHSHGLTSVDSLDTDGNLV